MGHDVSEWVMTSSQELPNTTSLIHGRFSGGLMRLMKQCSRQESKIKT